MANPGVPRGPQTNGKKQLYRCYMGIGLPDSTGVRFLSLWAGDEYTNDPDRPRHAPGLPKNCLNLNWNACHGNLFIHNYGSRFPQQAEPSGTALLLGLPTVPIQPQNWDCNRTSLCKCGGFPVVARELFL